MFNTLTRTYKERTPQETIQYIKQVLKQLDLCPEEKFYANPYPGVYSSSISLPSHQGGFRTNGKGRSREYSLASAYAEHMERMQNLLFATFSRTIVHLLKNEFGFFYYPDESHLSKSDLQQLPEDILEDFFRYSKQNRNEFIEAYFERIAANGLPGAVAIPFYDTYHRQLQLLPLNLLLISVGSNGMASGNTHAEATFQALCELMERWAAALIYYGQITPPTIPEDFIRKFPEEQAIIDAIESNGRYKVIVKDFSAGKKIPSIGLMIINPHTGHYKLNVGSDTSFQVALSRSLTEIFQGIQNEEEFNSLMLKIPDTVPDYFIRDDDEAKNIRFQVFSEFTRDNSGLFPPALFGKDPNYEFDPDTFSQAGSYEEEVKKLISYFHGNNINVYIRDASFLGFPSVFIYIPEISAQGRKATPSIDRNGTFTQIDLDHIEDLFFRLDRCTQQELTDIAKRLESFEKDFQIIPFFNIELISDSPWKKITIAFILAQIYYSLGDYKNALENLRHFLKSRNDTHPYYKLVEQYLQAKLSKKNGTEIKEELIQTAQRQNIQSEIVDQVMNDMAEPYCIEKHIPLPKCPNCVNCPLFRHCQTRHQLSLARIVYSNLSSLSQDKVSELIAVK